MKFWLLVIIVSALVRPFLTALNCVLALMTIRTLMFTSVRMQIWIGDLPPLKCKRKQHRAMEQDAMQFSVKYQSGKIDWMESKVNKLAKYLILQQNSPSIYSPCNR